MRLLVLSVFLLLVSSAFAQEITITPEYNSTQYLQSVTFFFQLSNNQSFDDSFNITLESGHNGWLTPQLPQKVSVKKSSEFNATFSLYPSDDIGSFKFAFKAVSNKNSSVFAEKTMALDVSHPEGVLLKSYTFNKGNESFSVDFLVKTLERKDLILVTEILDHSGSVVGTVPLEKKGFLGEDHLLSTIPNPVSAGQYIIRSKIESTSISRSNQLVIEPNSDIQQERVVESNFLSEEVRIKVTNVGNVEKSDYLVSEYVPLGTTISFVTEISSFEERGDKVKYNFKINELKPGDTVEIVYRVEYWQDPLAAVAIIIIAMAVVLWYANKLRSPRLRKRYIKRVDHYTVVLELKGSMFKHLSNITVRDWVSSLAKVQNKFETIKPVVKSSAYGTELVWKIGDLKKGDERLIQYDITPNEFGTIKLDKAWMRYYIGEKQEKAFSNVVVVDARKK